MIWGWAANDGAPKWSVFLLRIERFCGSIYTPIFVHSRMWGWCNRIKHVHEGGVKLLQIKWKKCILSANNRLRKKMVKGWLGEFHQTESMNVSPTQCGNCNQMQSALGLNAKQTYQRDIFFGDGPVCALGNVGFIATTTSKRYAEWSWYNLQSFFDKFRMLRFRNFDCWIKFSIDPYWSI